MAVTLAQPKKPVGGAYGSFLAEKRLEYTAACKGQRASAIAKMAGEAWQKLSEAEKAPYQQKYEAAKAKYDEDLKTFLEAGGQKSKGALALRTKRAMDPNQPKKPAAGGGYGVFLAKNREEIKKSLPEGHKITDVVKAASEKWKAMSEEAKKPFEAEFDQKMEQYKKAMEEYRLVDPSNTLPAVKRSRVGEPCAPEAAAIDAAV